MTASVTSIHKARDRAELAALRQTAGMPACPKCGNNRQVWRNQITGLITCHRAYCHTVLERSEGTASAQRINHTSGQSLTGDPLLLHRIDAHQLTTAPLAEVPGRIEQRQCAPGLCQGLAGCRDVFCEGHPANAPTEADRDPVALRWFLVGYCTFIGACLLAIANADGIYHWLTR